jgi:hypothetical protein
LQISVWINTKGQRNTKVVVVPFPVVPLTL